MLGDIQRRGYDGERPAKKGGDSHYRAARIQKQGRTRRDLQGDLFSEALFGFRQQRIAALTVHGGEIQRDGSAVVLLRQTTVLGSVRSRRMVSAETCSFSASSVMLAWPCSLRISRTWRCRAVLCIGYIPAKYRNSLHNTAF